MYRILLLVGCFFCACSCQGQKTAGDRLSLFIQSKGDSLLAEEALPGIFVGLIDVDGRRQYFNFGYAVPEEKLPFDAATLFEAGSITKTFTALVLERVLEEKGIEDTALILPFLPDSVQRNQSLASITFLSLLNHTSGLPRLPSNLSLNRLNLAPYDHYSDNDLYAYLASASPAANGKPLYSNLGAGLAGVLARRISGKNFDTLLQQYVFVPFGIAQREKLRRSQGFFLQEKTPFWNMDALWPAGGLHCTTAELLSYLSVMSRPSPAFRQMVTKLLQPTAQVAPTIRVARAWHTVEEKEQPLFYWHNGGTYGFSTFAAFVPGTGQAVVVVVNRFNANNTSDGFGMAIMRKMLQQF